MIAAGASLWGLDAVLRKPLTAIWSSWTIVLYEHVLLTLAVAPILWLNRERIRRAVDRCGWASALVVAWGGSALATLAFTEAFAWEAQPRRGGAAAEDPAAVGDRRGRAGRCASGRGADLALLWCRR